MSDAFSAMELEEMRLSALPTTRQAIELKAKQEEWAFITIKSRGRNGQTKKFIFSAMPVEIQNCIRSKLTNEILNKATPSFLPTSQVDLFPNQGVENGLTERQRLVESARKGVLKAIEDVMAIAKVSKEGAMQTVLTQARMGGYEHIAKMFELARDGRGATGDLPSVRTIKRWFAARDEGNLVPIIPTANVKLPDWASVFLTH